MTAHSNIAPAAGGAAAFDQATYNYAASHGFVTEPGCTRYDGWTPERQATFLAALGEGLSVVQACAVVGLSRQSAYALRNSARGAGFALGWDAAVLKARDVLVDELMERAFRGNRDTVTYDDGRMVTRHRHDNRLAMAMLNRLDRMADSAKAPAHAAAARLIASDFAQYLELLGRDAGPGRTGVFLAARLPAGVTPAGEDDLAPLRTLARADRWLRTRTDLAEPLETQDLDPAARDRWSAEQWLRAEAAGLVSLPADTHEKRDSRQDCQLRGPARTPAESILDGTGPVWWDELSEEWRTCFPAPEGFTGREEGSADEGDYSRTLTRDEFAVVRARYAEQRAVIDAEEAAERDAWFAALAAGEGDAEGDADASAGEDAGAGESTTEAATPPVRPEPVEGREPDEDENGEDPTVRPGPVEGRGKQDGRGKDSA